MSSFIDDAKTHFGTSDLYEILGFKTSKRGRSTLTYDQIKKSFFKASLRYHPDRCNDSSKKGETTVKFQILSRAYSILGDSEKRAVYDETGIIDDSEVCSDNVDWTVVWRAMFKEVTLAEIDEYLKNFRDSREEWEEVKEAYIKHKGNMERILKDVTGVSYEDEDRLRNMINDMIESGELKATSAFVAEPEKRRARRRKAAEREAMEAEEMMKEIREKEGISDLKALILKRQQRNQSELDAFCDSLAAKYAKKPKKQRK